MSLLQQINVIYREENVSDENMLNGFLHTLQLFNLMNRIINSEALKQMKRNGKNFC